MTKLQRETGTPKPWAHKPFRHNRPLQAIAAVCLVLWVVAAIAPHDRFDWFLENLLVFAGVAALLATYRVSPLSDLSYGLIALFLLLHIVGSHYTYSLAPPGVWIQEALGLDRNHFDRVVHFCFGLLLAYPAREALARALDPPGFWPFVLAFSILTAASNVYEMIEWAAAEVISPEAAMAFLGTQGDVFDAQKDTALAAAGAIVGLGFAELLLRRRRRAERA